MSQYNNEVNAQQFRALFRSAFSGLNREAQREFAMRYNESHDPKKLEELLWQALVHIAANRLPAPVYAAAVQAMKGIVADADRTRNFELRTYLHALEFRSLMNLLFEVSNVALTTESARRYLLAMRIEYAPRPAKQNRVEQIYTRVN